MKHYPQAKRFFLSLVALALVMGAFAFAQAQDPVPLTIFRGGVDIDPNTDPVMQELERLTDTDITFKTAAWSEIPQVRNLALSVEEDVDIYHHMNLDPQWIEDEVIIPLDDYINPEDHPYLTAITSAETFANAKYEGQTYYIPMISDGYNWVLAARKDWMDELELDMPTNEEEFREMLRAFGTLDDTGRTVGWQLEGGCQIRRSILPILTAFGASTSFYNSHADFTLEDGVLVPVATSDNVKAGLRYLNSLYNEGLVNTDFPSMTSMPMLNERYMQAGKSGVAWVQNPRNTEMAEADAEWAYIPPFSAEGFEHVRGQGIANNGWIAVSATSENPQKAVDLLEFVNSLEGRKLLVAGVEGVHYNTLSDDNTFDRIDEAWDADYDGPTYPLNFYFGQGLMHGYIPAVDYDTFEEALDNVQIWEPASLPGRTEVVAESAKWVGEPDPFQFVNFPDLEDNRTELQDAVCVGWTKAITADEGEFDNTWDEFLASWDRSGGEEWTAAYQAYYDENLR